MVSAVDKKELLCFFLWSLRKYTIKVHCNGKWQRVFICQLFKQSPKHRTTILVSLPVTCIPIPPSLFFLFFFLSLCVYVLKWYINYSPTRQNLQEILWDEKSRLSEHIYYINQLYHSAYIYDVPVTVLFFSKHSKIFYNTIESPSRCFLTMSHTSSLAFHKDYYSLNRLFLRHYKLHILNSFRSPIL